jgi:hypothetical protein
MEVMLAAAATVYSALALLGLAWSGVAQAYWRTILLPVLRTGEPFTEPERPKDLLFRMGAFLCMALLFVSFVVLLSPIGVYRCLWELWRRRWRGGPPPPKAPAIAKRVKAA